MLNTAGTRGKPGNCGAGQVHADIPDGLAWSDFRGYEDLQDVAVSQPETGSRLFPEGSKVTKIEWSFKRNPVSPYSINVPDTLKTVAFIEKDTVRFPDTHGWAYAQWDYVAHRVIVLSRNNSDAFGAKQTSNRIYEYTP